MTDNDTPIHDRLADGTPDAPNAPAEDTQPTGDTVSRWLTPARRKRLYEIAAAAVAVFTIYVPSFADQAPAWLNLAAVVLGAGGTAGLVLARNNV